MVRGVREGAWSVAGIVILLLILASTDERVRARFALVLDNPVEGGFTLGTRMADLLNAVLLAAREQIAMNGPLSVFAIVAIILVVFMARS